MWDKLFQKNRKKKKKGKKTHFDDISMTLIPKSGENSTRKYRIYEYEFYNTECNFW